MSVKVRAPMRRRRALSLEKAISMGFGSGLYGGRNRNLFDTGGKAQAIRCAFDRPGCDRRIGNQPCNERLRPPRSEGRIHRRALPSRRPSMRAGRIGFDRGFIDKYTNKDTALRLDRYCWNAIPEPVLALHLYLGAATFGGNGCLFCTRGQACAGNADGIGGRLNACCVMQGGGAFGHSNVAISFDDFDGKGPMGGKSAFPPWGDLAAQAFPVRRIARPHRAPVAGESCSATPPHAHLTLLQSIPENASEARPASVPTRSFLPNRMNRKSTPRGILPIRVVGRTL